MYGGVSHALVNLLFKIKIQKSWQLNYGGT